jgi:hypothetical protein
MNLSYGGLGEAWIWEDLERHAEWFVSYLHHTNPAKWMY